MSLNLINVKFFKMVNSNVTGNDNDLCCRCHICGDSHKSKSKKRLHLYTKPSFKSDVVHCFNCDYHASAFNYFKAYHPDIFSAYKNEMVSDALNTLKLEDISLDCFAKEKDNEKLISYDEFKKITNPLTKEGLRYLRNRNMTNDDIKELKVRYCVDELTLYGKTINAPDSIIIPFLDNDDNVFGFQTRSIKEKKFYIVLHPVYQGMKMWNLEKIDKTKPVYVFEGVFDAMSSGFKNKIALLGIHNYKHLNDLDCIFCLDNQKIDKTSLEICRELAKKNKKIFIWNRNDCKDFNELLNITESKEEIQKIIKKNIFKGLEAYIRL